MAQSIDLTLEQQILKYMAETKKFTCIIDLAKALKEPEYAKELITGNGLDDEIQNSGGGSSAECEHKALTNDEIQEVFDNDNE